MADVATVPDQVLVFPGVGSLSQLFVGLMGEDYSQGDAVYRDDAHSKYYLADSSSLAKAACAGFCTSSGKAGQYCSIIPPNNLQLSTVLSGISFGVQLKIGQVYVISNTPGKIKDIASLTDTEFVTIVGYAKNYTVMAIIQLLTSVPYNEFITNPGDAMGLLGLTYP